MQICRTCFFFTISMALYIRQILDVAFSMYYPAWLTHSYIELFVDLQHSVRLMQSHIGAVRRWCFAGYRGYRSQSLPPQILDEVTKHSRVCVIWECSTGSQPQSLKMRRSTVLRGAQNSFLISAVGISYTRRCFETRHWYFASPPNGMES